MTPNADPHSPQPDRLIGRRQLIEAGGLAGLLVGASVLVEAAVAPPAAAASVSYRDDGTNYVVNTGSNLVFKVNHTNGDLTSLVYRGVEYQGYNNKNSQVESG